MPKLKITKDELDVKDLDEAEYDDSDMEYADYEGEDPPAKIMLTGYVKKLWWTYTQEKADGTGGDPMLKVLVVADDNAGEFEGWPGWDNVPLTKSSKFRWKPFLDALGLDLKTVFGKTYVDEDGYTDNLGTPIEKIGDWEPGEDNDAAYLTFRTKRERYNGEWSTKIARYFPYKDPSDDAEEGEEPEEERPARRKPAKPAAKKPAARKPARRRPKPEPDDEEYEEEEDIDPDDVEEEDVEPEEEEEETPRRPARRTLSGRGAAKGGPAKSRGKASASASTATRGRGRSGPKLGAPVGDDDPPF